MPIYRKKCRRINDPGHAHALTFSCFQRRPFLSKDRSRQWLVDSIAAARRKHGFHVWAYVIMPEHVHLLIWPIAAVYNVSSILTSIKHPVSRAAVAFVKREAPAF